MSSIKNEFKEFINTLSTEICDNVLIKELEGINQDFTTLVNDYDRIEKSYNQNIKEIEKQIMIFSGNNNIINSFVKSINDNNDKVNKAIKVIEEEHKTVITGIVADNQKIFKAFNDKVQALNKSERELFISELSNRLNMQSQQQLIQLKAAVNTSNIGNASENISALLDKVNMMDIKFNKMNIVLGNIEGNVFQKLEAKAIQNENYFKEGINKVNLRINDLTKKIDENNTVLISKFEEKLAAKEKNLKTLIIAQIVIAILILLNW